FGNKGMTADVVTAIRMSGNAALDLDKARTLLQKRKAIGESSKNEEEGGTSLIARPRIRRRVINDDEIEDTPAQTSTTEPVLIPSDEDTVPRDTNESTQHLFDSGFESGELRPVFDEVPLSSFAPTSSIPLPTVSVSLPALTASVLSPVLTAPTSIPMSTSSVPASTPTTPVVFTFSTTPPSAVPSSSVPHVEVSSSNRGMTMRSVTLEIPANQSLLRKSGRADTWLEPLIGEIEKNKMQSHSCYTLMNDIVHSTLKANLIGTELMGRVSTLEKKERESTKALSEARKIAEDALFEAANWKEQFESAQVTVEELQESKAHLEQQNRGLTSELGIVNASWGQLKRDKELLECSLSKANDEIKELKALMEKKEEYARELAQNLTHAQNDLRISSDKIRALESSHASLEASLDSHLAEHQIMKNDLAMWEKEYKALEKEYNALEENFNIDVSWAFLNSRRDALMEATQENFDLQSELAKVIDTIEKGQQPADTPSPALGTIDTPSPALEAPGTEEFLNSEAVTEVLEVVIPASEGETSMTQSMGIEVPVTITSLVDVITSSSAETAPIAASSEVVTAPVIASESDVTTFNDC
ncbi:PREDICTED: uncharacterized protein LOC109217203, partial [Nicotiana attenuata]|uniref:uncharacterized protein LOC109217203 n=1 Tax=Nicotiana attenuata TaxID=49451 RepID=UPI000904F34E